MTLTTPLLDDWCYLARHARPDEQDEFAAMTGAPYNPEVAARAWANTPGPTWCLLGADGLPVAAGGYEELRPGVYAAWMVGTPAGWERYWRSITKTCLRTLRALFANGAHRVQITTLARRTAACGWYLHGLKLACEGHHPGGAADGSDTVTYGRAA